MSLEMDRSRRHTALTVLNRIDRETQASLESLGQGSDEAVSRKIEELDREWDVDRTLEAESSIVALTGLALGASLDRRFFVIPGFVASMVLLQAVTGWYPLLPTFRRVGIRTSREIQRYRYALKALRGDFDNLDGLPSDDAALLDGSMERSKPLLRDTAKEDPLAEHVSHGRRM